MVGFLGISRLKKTDWQTYSIKINTPEMGYFS